MKTGRILLIVLAGGGGIFAAEPEAQIVSMTLRKRPLEGGDPLGYGNCQWLYPSDTPLEPKLELPPFGSTKPIYFSARLGDTKDNTFSLAMDEGAGDGAGYDVLYVDKNNDNRLDATAERISFSMGTRRGSPPLHVAFDVTTGNKTATIHFRFSSFPYTDDDWPVEKIHANLRDSSYYVGEATFGGALRKIAIADLDTNGLFNDPEKRLFEGDRFFVDLPDDPNQPSSRKYWDSFPYGTYTEIAGQWYSVVATPDGSQVTIRPAKPEFGTVEAPAQIAEATLYSDALKQKQTLTFSKGRARGLLGPYKLNNVVVRDTRSTGGTWDIRGSFRSVTKTITIEKERIARLEAGPPFRLEIEPTKSKTEGAVDLKSVITGCSGGAYRWYKMNSERPRGAVVVTDEKGEVVLSEQFAFG